MDASEARRRVIATGAILVVLTLERLAFYALFSSFFLFLNEGPWSKPVAWSSLDAMNAVFVLSGISYLSALLGGYISDAWLGRFKTMLLGFVMYIVGYVLLTLIAVDSLPRSICSTSGFADQRGGSTSPHPPCKNTIYITIAVVGIGVGIVKSNITPFGAEQLRTADPHVTRSFFNWFYWCINLGSLVGVGAIAFIEQDSPGICTNGFFCGYLIAAVCLVVAMIIFIAVYPCYHIARVEGSLLGSIFRIVWEAIKAQVQHWHYSRRNPNLSPFHVEPNFLDRAKVCYGGSFHEGAVDDVRALGKLLAVFTALIPYWLVYFQMETSFQAQGLHMRFAEAAKNTSIDTYVLEMWRFTIPAAWLTLFNQLFLVIAIPILTNFMYPVLDRRGLRLSMLFRIGLGMVFSTLAVMTAGGLESYRTFLWRTDNSTHIDQVIGNVTYNAVDISIFWQVPQYVLVGAAEAFASIAGLEFAYSAAPHTFQGMIMGLFYSMEGCGSFLGTVLLQLVAPFWLSNTVDYGNINDNHLDFYLYFLGVLQFITLLIFAGILYVQRFSLRLVLMPPPDQGLVREGRRRLYRERLGSPSHESIEEEDLEEMEQQLENENGDEQHQAGRESSLPEDQQLLL